MVDHVINENIIHMRTSLTYMHTGLTYNIVLCICIQHVHAICAYNIPSLLA